MERQNLGKGDDGGSCGRCMAKLFCRWKFDRRNCGTGLDGEASTLDVQDGRKPLQEDE